MRVVSLVPSLTEAVASVDPSILIGATVFCIHPPDLDVVRVGGSKYPAVRDIIALAPDLVLANVEENRKEDIEELRAAGIEVWVSYPTSVDTAFATLREMFEVIGLDAPDWLDEAEAVWAPPPDHIAGRAIVPVWRRPWVLLGSDTFAGDVLRRIGVTHLYFDAPERYPRPSIEEINELRPSLIVLPDEPYAFSDTDGPEAFPDTPYALVSGRHLTWYGPSLMEARELLTNQLVRGVVRGGGSGAGPVPS